MRSALFAAMFALFAAGAASAATIEVKDAWIRTPPPGAPTAAGYATITNHGVSSDRLTGASTSVAASADMHQMSMAGGVMRMRAISGGLPIAASGSVKFAPNGNHLMLVGLKGPLRAGAHVKVMLKFQRAGAVAADFVVRDAAPGSMAGMHM
jgi:copper(I)-binding protein